MKGLTTAYIKELAALLFLCIPVVAQTQTDTMQQARPKVAHAEPLYVDLVRDLGARKGEREINVGAEFSATGNYNEYNLFAEYEWAPVHHLGLEVEAVFSFFSRTNESEENVPANKPDRLKLATQYSFFVSETYKTTLALGYMHEFELTDYQTFSKGTWVSGNVYSPFFVAAKRWGNHFHTLLYTGPQFHQNFASGALTTTWQINTSFHYMLTGTKHFIGVEVNKAIGQGHFDVFIHPQLKLKLSDRLAIGFVLSFPTNKRTHGFGSFMRIIYEP